MKKRIFSLITVAAIFILSFTVVASADNLISNGDFEDAAFFWEAGEISAESPYDGDFSLMISNPISTPVDAGFPHIAEYIPEISLEESCLYSLSFFVCSTDTDVYSDFYSDVKFSSSSNRIVFEGFNIPAHWTRVSVMFLAGKSNEYGLSFTLFSAHEDTVFYIDNLSLTQMDFRPTSIQIDGPSHAYIPEAGYASYEYSASTVDSDKNVIPIITGDLYAIEPLPDGVSFDEASSSLIVESYAPAGATVTLACSPPSGTAGLPDGSFTVTLDKNIVSNGSFEDFPSLSGWDTEGSRVSVVSDGVSSFASLTLAPDDEHIYSVTLSPSKTLVLMTDTMYVFRARVKSEAGFETRKISSPNAVIDEATDTVRINLSDIGGSEWSEVISVIQVAADGIYNLDINVFSSDMRPVYIDDIQIAVETPEPADVIFNAPAHISIGSSVSVPFDFAVRDQSENILSDDAYISVYPENSGVTLSDKSIFISDSAASGTYTITGVSNQNPSASGTHSFTLSEEAIGDGSFEYSLPGHLWATSLPSEFKTVTTHADLYPTEGARMGRLSMNGNVSILYSDSVKRYTQGESYVFGVSMVKVVPDIDTVVTVLLVDSYSMSLDDSLVVCQFELSRSYQSVQRVFTPSASVTGKLMIAFTTPQQHDSQVILLDNISVDSAAVSALNVSIGGSPYPEMLLTGKYKFTSNFGGADASTYRWLMSSAANGVYIPISGQTSQTLSVTPDMAEKYIKFEVTPISLSGPVSGKSVMSSYVRIGYPLPENTDTPEEDVPDDNQGTGNSTTLPSHGDTVQPPDNTAPEERGELSVIDLSPYYSSASAQYFADMQGHWAYDDVVLMAAAGIVNGRGDNLFMPSETITRAEFSAFLIRAFRLAPLYYEKGFDDVKPWDWYAGIVETVTRYEIAQGVGDRIFAPDLPITREQMAVMLMRAYAKTGAPVPDGSIAGFSDWTQISSWATSDVGNAAALGILNGTDQGRFEPKRNATRAEAIVAIRRMIDKGTLKTQN